MSSVKVILTNGDDIEEVLKKALLNLTEHEERFQDKSLVEVIDTINSIRQEVISDMISEISKELE